jgi:hypothetical protein
VLRLLATSTFVLYNLHWPNISYSYHMVISAISEAWQEGVEIIIIRLLMQVQQNTFTLLRVLLVLTDRGILAQSNQRRR